MKTCGALAIGACAALSLFVGACTPTLHGTVNQPRYAALRSVVVLPFATPEGAAPSLSESFADELSSHLAGARFAVLDHGATARAGGGEDSGGFVDSEAEVARAARGADAVVIGRVLTYQDRSTTPKVDTTLAVSIRVVDARTGQVVLSTSADATAAALFCSQDMACLRGKVMAELGHFVSTGEE